MRPVLIALSIGGLVIGAAPGPTPPPSPPLPGQPEILEPMEPHEPHVPPKAPPAITAMPTGPATIPPLATLQEPSGRAPSAAASTSSAWPGSSVGTGQAPEPSGAAASPSPVPVAGTSGGALPWIFIGVLAAGGGTATWLIARRRRDQR